MTLATVVTWNLVFKGVVGGLITALVAMGIVLVYRSSRVINFAVGSIGLPATALFAVMVGVHGWPYWPSLFAALAVGTLTGVLVELAVIRRLFKSPRVIVLVATIGVAQLCEAITLSLPAYRTGSLQTQFPVPFSGTWYPGLGIEVSASQLLVLIVVPVITVGLWWLLGHTAFGDAVRAAASNSDLARMTGINPKMVSTGVWAIAGFLGTVAILLTATDQTSADLVHIGPDTLLRGMAAALIGGMVSFPRAAVGAVLIGILDRVLFFNYTSETGLVQFVLFLAVLVLVARVSRNETGAEGESFQFEPRIAAVPERLRSIWWVKRLPQLVAALTLLVALVLPFLSDKSERHQTWATIIAFALCAISVVVLTGWGGQLSLGQMAFAGLGALTAGALIRGLQFNIGWRGTRFLDGGLPSISFPWALLLGAAFASLVAVIVGIGALRVRGLLLAISTLAFAIAAQAYIFSRPIFTAGSTTIEIPRTDLGPLELTHRNRAYYYCVLFVLVLVLVLVSHLKRTGIGRMIVGVRENELATSAMTVSPARAKLLAFAMGGFIAGLGGVLLGAVNLTFAPAEQHFFLVDDSLRLVAIVVIGGLGSLAGAVAGAVWVIGLPAFWPSNTLVPLFTSSIGLLIILLYIPGGFVQIGYYVRDSLLRWVDKRLGPVDTTKTVTAPPASLHRDLALEPASLNGDGSGARRRAPDGPVRRSHRGRRRRVPGHARRGDRPHRQQRRREVDAAERDRGLRTGQGHRAAPGPRREQQEGVPACPPRARPNVPVGASLSRAHRARHRAARARGPPVDVVLGLPVVGAVDPARAQEVRGGERAHRLPRTRSLCRPVRRRALDRDAPHRGAGDGPRGRAARHLPRRAHGGGGPA